MEDEPEKINFAQMKKKGKKGKQKTEPQTQESDTKYKEMLGRFFELLREKSGRTMDNDRKIVLKLPEVQRLGTTKTAWINFQEISDMLCRPPDHLYKFFFVELGTDGSVSGSHLILKGRFHEKQIEALLKRYITEYVRCPMCRSMQTTLLRESSIRMFQMKCEKCGCTRSVQPIKELYHHVSRGERKKAR